MNSIEAALDLAQKRKSEGKSQLSVARELGDMGMSDGDATGIAAQVYKEAIAPNKDINEAP